MPRANRHSLSGHVWHLTHRCHCRQFLLRHRKDRRRWLFWLAAARKRYGLRVLNYIVTRNHIHLLVYDEGHGEVARSMQLIAGRTAQEYNRRKNRRGAYWEDRYHATAVSTDRHLVACMRYIDLNMVRAGAVKHPMDWAESGYRAIQDPPKRYRIIDLGLLVSLLSCPDVTSLQAMLAKQVDAALHSGCPPREPLWSKSVAVGNEDFVTLIRAQLGPRAGRRGIGSLEHEGVARHFLREEADVAYDANASGACAL